jgi:amino acid transporter
MPAQHARGFQWVYCGVRTEYFHSLTVSWPCEFPHVSLLLVGGLAILCSLLPLLTVINALLTTRILVQFVGQVGAVLWLRRQKPDVERPFKMWLYPVPAFVALAGWLFLFATTDPRTLLNGAFVLALGVLLFLGWARWTKRWPCAL